MLNKANLQIAELACKEESRFTLNGILVTPQETVATDGHILARVTTPKVEGDFPDVPGCTRTEQFEPFVLDSKTAKEIIRLIPRNPTLPILEHVSVGSEGSNGTAALAVTDLDRTRVFLPKKLTGKFPDFSVIFPKKPAEYVVAFNCDLLIAALKQVRRFIGHASACAVLEIHGPQSPLVISTENDGQRMDVLLMPMRDERSMGYCGPKAVGTEPKTEGAEAKTL